VTLLFDTHAKGSASILMWQSESTKTYKRGGADISTPRSV